VLLLHTYGRLLLVVLLLPVPRLLLVVLLAVRRLLLGRRAAPGGGHPAGRGRAGRRVPSWGWRSREEARHGQQVLEGACVLRRRHWLLVLLMVLLLVLVVVVVAEHRGRSSQGQAPRGRRQGAGRRGQLQKHPQGLLHRVLLLLLLALLLLSVAVVVVRRIACWPCRRPRYLVFFLHAPLPARCSVCFFFLLFFCLSTFFFPSLLCAG
jgi:uncharacterized membrane protein YhaH (DUF805 family)